MIAHGNYIGDFSSFDKGSHVQMIIDCMVNRLDNEHYYRPDVERTDGRFNDVFLPGVLREGLCRVNSEFLVKAIDETVVKLGEMEEGSLAQLNELGKKKCDSSAIPKQALYYPSRAGGNVPRGGAEPLHPP